MTAGLVRVRPGSADDLLPVLRIERASFGDPWSPTALLAELEPSFLHLPLIAEFDDEVAGYLMAWLVHDELHVLNVAVAPEARRRGVGEALMAAAMDAGRRAGLHLVTLEVRVSNLGARAFYDRLGFCQEGVRKRYYPDTGEDALVMTRALA